MMHFASSIAQPRKILFLTKSTFFNQGNIILKKLDKLILKAFIGPFLATFIISIFVLVLQFFWLWIDDFVGKGIDTLTLFKVIGYVALSWVPIALPLAMLLSTIMTFGNLGESYELVAIKSAGISLTRFMLPVMIFALVATGVAYVSNNYIIPVVNLKLNRMQYEIVYSKPAFDIKPGVFYDKIDGYVIKLGKKEKDGQQIEDILIYERGNYLQDNTLIADSGVMRVSDDKRFLEFDLRNGTRYEEKGIRGTTNTELTRVSFGEYKKVFDLASFFKVKTSDSAFKDNYKMLSQRQLKIYSDSLQKRIGTIEDRIKREVGSNLLFAVRLDSSFYKVPNPKPMVADTSIHDIIPDSAMFQSVDMALSKISNAKSTLDILEGDLNAKARDRRHYELAWHQKFSLAFACFVLFLIGAPLGSIIRKGGLGTPLVFAVIFFVIFHLLNSTGEKLVKSGVLHPIVGTWLPVIALTPVALFLIVKARKDSQLFNKEFYFRVFKDIKNIRAKKNLNRADSNT